LSSERGGRSSLLQSWGTSSSRQALSSVEGAEYESESPSVKRHASSNERTVRGDVESASVGRRASIRLMVADAVGMTATPRP